MVFPTIFEVHSDRNSKVVPVGENSPIITVTFFFFLLNWNFFFFLLSLPSFGECFPARADVRTCPGDRQGSKGLLAEHPGWEGCKWWGRRFMIKENNFCFNIYKAAVPLSLVWPLHSPERSGHGSSFMFDGWENSPESSWLSGPCWGESGAN